MKGKGKKKGKRTRVEDEGAQGLGAGGRETWGLRGGSIFRGYQGKENGERGVMRCGIGQCGADRRDGEQRGGGELW